jgi:hypothetical protein
LHAVHAVDAVDEQDQYEDEGDLLVSVDAFVGPGCDGLYTFKPYWSFATSGFSDTKVKSLRFTVNGRGMMRVMKTAISKTRRANT